MNINELLAAIDNTRRQYGQNVLAAVQNPVEAFQNSLARYAQENLPTPSERQDAMSVMPGMGDAMMQKVNALAMMSMGAIKPTVMRPLRMQFPEIYGDPRQLVADASSRVEAEDPLLQRLFGVSREDLWDIGQQGQRPGTTEEVPFKTAKNPKGAAAAEEVMNSRNVNRLQSIISEAQKDKDLYQAMASWYVMDPLFGQFVKQFGPEEAVKRYNQFNTFSGMASPGTEVLSELNRGSAANWLHMQGRFQDFVDYGGKKPGVPFPPDMTGVEGHVYHQTAQAGPMQKYVDSGALDMKSAKVPSYIAASGVPETGFQTAWPVGDAHWARLVGLPDVRTATTPQVLNASASVPEMTSLAPWFRNQVASPSNLEAVPAQAVLWGAGSGATGVTSQIGAGKLELLAKQIGKTAQRLGVTPETARDMIIRGETHAGFITPELAAALAAGALGGAELRKYLKDQP